jgi:hypothetical protein
MPLSFIAFANSSSSTIISGVYMMAEETAVIISPAAIAFAARKPRDVGFSESFVTVWTLSGGRG